jgi:micrococcal nuclease
MRWILGALALTLAACGDSLTLGPPAPTIEPALPTAEVIRVSDGDSLTVKLRGVKTRVRIEGIDAPELQQAGSKGATSALAGLVKGRTVEVQETGKDRYGRTLAQIRADGKDVGVELVRQGWAWHFTRYNKDADLAEAEQEARRERRGLWQGSNPIPPWDWRKARGHLEVSE